MATQAETNIRPAVPVAPDRIVDYDVFGDKRFYEEGDLHKGLFRLGEEDGRGIFWTPHNGGHWLINDHELLFQAARNTEIFSSNNRESQDGAMVMIPPMADHGEPRFAPQSLDPPEHGTYRLPLVKAFAPKRILEMEGWVRELAVKLIDELAPKGRGEFLAAVGEPMPVTVFMRMMGMPLDRLAEFRSWMHAIASDSQERRSGAFANIAQAMGELIEARKADPQDDLISDLLASDLDGRKPSMVDMQSYCLLLFTAGLDTLVNTFTFGMYHLARHPELQERLQADRCLIPELMEEILRRYGVAMPPRVVTRDYEFGGVNLTKGELIMLMLPAGNLDGKAFADPMTFDIDREDKTHITFNSGPHRCVGSHLARLELRVFFEEWFARMPVVRPDPDQLPTYRPGLNLTIAELPLLWEPVAG
ncbi:MAG: cytochrome P450 [Novosphingobium sp.]|nr:cytochrome P450 [Novosphingobium sp.]